MISICVDSRNTCWDTAFTNLQAKLHPTHTFGLGQKNNFNLWETGIPTIHSISSGFFKLNPVYGIVSWFLETCNLLIFILSPFPWDNYPTLPSLVNPSLYHNSHPIHTNCSPNWPLTGTPKQSHCPWECAHAHLPWVTLEVFFWDFGKGFPSKRMWQKGVLLGKWFKNKNILEENWFQI